MSGGVPTTAGSAGDAAEGAAVEVHTEVHAPAAPLEEDDVSLTTIAFYALPVGIVLFSSSLLGFFFLKFATDILLVAPAAAGTVIFAGRLWDAFNDPLIGRLSDRTRSRWGRRRPWFVASAVPLGLSIWALWAPPESLDERGLVLWLLVAMLAYLTFYSTFRVPHLALGAELVRDYHKRTRVFAGSQIFESFGLVLAALSIGLIENSDDPRATAAMIAGSVALATAAVLVLSAALMHERVEFQQHHDDPAREVFRDVFRNPHARRLLGVFFFDQLGFSTTIAALPFLVDYVVNDGGRTFVYMGAAVVSLMLSIPLWVTLSTRLEKKPVWIASLLVKMGVLVSLFWIDPASPAATTWLLLGVMTIGALSGPTTVIGPSLKADVVDWDEARSGKRREGAYFATWNFAQKSATGLAGAALGIAFSAFGYVQNAVQTEAALLGIRASATLGPLAFHIIAVAFLWRFALDRKAHREAQLEAERRRGAA